MSDDSSKRAIPAWQRAQQPLKPESNPPTEQQSHDPKAEDKQAPRPEESTPQEDPQEPAVATSSADEETISPAERPQQLEIVRSFLEDPGVKDEPLEKKRAFLQSKGITEDMIDQELGKQSSLKFSTSDFASFKETTQTRNAPPATRPTGPPIITYPEFLEDARKPAPLITPSRILNATYVASGIAALAYGASTFLIKPMSVSLTDARHDFASHGQSKIDELNERLSKLVSKIPQPKSSGYEADSDAESVTSDPTELFHRDIGTQTSPAISPPANVNAGSETRTISDGQNDRMIVIKSHLEELLAGVEAGERPAKERMEETNKLRHELDNMMYRVQTSNAWGGFSMDQKSGGEPDDGIEELKKEIRGVKGVLLSAKRFAPVGPAQGRVGG